MLLCITLIYIVYGGLITQPQLKYVNEEIPNNNYTRQAKETFSLQYGAYPGVFAIDLHKRINGHMDAQSIDLGDFEKVEEDQLEEYGCFAIERNIEMTIQLKLWLDKTGVTRNIYFTDLATSVRNGRIYVVRNDFMLFSANVRPGYYGIELETFRKSFAKELNYEDNEDNHPFLIDDDLGLNRIYAITANGGISINTGVVAAEAEVRIEEAVKQRKRVFNVHYNIKNKLIFVACGYEGIDIYSIVEDKLKLVSSISTIDLLIPNGQVIDIDSDGEHNLYVLDKETGLRFYLIYYNQISASVAHLFTITISNAKSFDNYQSTFFIVAQTVNKQDYAVEVFVNIHQRDYFYNTFYIDEMTINDVNVFKYYAVLIGDDGHKIVYHSIYSGFLNEQLVSHTSFQEADLFKVKEYKYDDQLDNVKTLAGIAKYELKFFSIIMNHPSVECVIENPEKVEYLVRINSTNCNEKEDSFSHQFTLCNITHQFSLTTTERPGNYHTYAYYTIVVYVLFVVVVWVIIFGYICFKKWGHRISLLSWMQKRSAAAAPYNESFDVKEQELPEQQKQQQ